MAFTIALFETITGKYVSDLDGNIRSWAIELNGTSTFSIQLSPGMLTLASRGHIANITTPQRMSLAILWDQMPVGGGPIVARGWDGKALNINAVDVKTGILGARKAHNWAMPYASQVLSYTGISLGTIAVRLVRDVACDPAKGGSALPIVYPADSSSSDPTHERHYNGFENKDIASLLDDLTGVLNGPDIDFVLAWTDASHTHFQWIMRVGTPAAPYLIATDQIVLDATQPQSAVKQVGYVEDVSQMGTTDWASGSGDDIATLMSKKTSTTLTDAGWPLLERERDYKTVEIQTTLDTYAYGDLNRNQTPTIQFGLVIDISQPPAFGSYQLGDVARLRIKNHVWIPDNDNYVVRILGMSGDGMTTVKLSVQEVV